MDITNIYVISHLQSIVILVSSSFSLWFLVWKEPISCLATKSKDVKIQAFSSDLSPLRILLEKSNLRDFGYTEEKSVYRGQRAHCSLKEGGRGASMKYYQHQYFSILDNTTNPLNMKNLEKLSLAPSILIQTLIGLNLYHNHNCPKTGRMDCKTQIQILHIPVGTLQLDFSELPSRCNTWYIWIITFPNIDKYRQISTIYKRKEKKGNNPPPPLFLHCSYTALTPPHHTFYYAKTYPQ